MRLEEYTVLARYLHHLLGAQSFDELKSMLRLAEEGPSANGQSYFFEELVKQTGLLLSEDELRVYDKRVMEYETRLVRIRSEFKAFRYFQYLALLYTEIFLDRLTRNSRELLADLNVFLCELREDDSELRDFPEFEMDNLRRLAFFMATGSGKTLLLHVNVWQVLYYLEHSRHPESIVPRTDGWRTFDNILLITPNEGLSRQHITEFEASGIEACVFIENPTASSLFGPVVKVIEIHKLSEEPSREGVSVVLDDLGENNLILVDEGHKGTGSEAQVWKSRQRYLSRGGFLLEYSATFAQAIGAASRRRDQKELSQEYGKAILFDYSYAHFYGDGYGKKFNVLNLSRGTAGRAHELLLGGLLTYYQQLLLYEQKSEEYRPYNIEKPLWVMLGSSVNAMYIRDSQRRSDVAEVVAFLRRVLEEQNWATEVIGRILSGNSGFTDTETELDLFAPYISHLYGKDPEMVYGQIIDKVFHGGGALEVWEIKNVEGELGLRASAGDSQNSPYFAVINIGDVSEFRKYLDRHLDIEVQEDRFVGSQFEQVNRADSLTNILIGAKKFIEGWSSWRVSSMGLLNMGRGEGPQIMQLFGRGVRLKGKDMSLKRTEALLTHNGHPEGIEHLETLYIFGWNADYIDSFQNMLGREDIGKEFTINVDLRTPWPKDDLPVPKKEGSFDTGALTWTLESEGITVTIDLVPHLIGLRDSVTGGVATRGRAGTAVEIDFSRTQYLDLLDLDLLYADLVRYKQTRGYGNVYVRRGALPEILQKHCRLRIPEEDEKVPDHLQHAAGQLLKTYLDRFVRYKEREAESQHIELGWLEADERVLKQYKVRVKSGEFLEQIEALLGRGLDLFDAPEPLPRFYIDWHLFNPILAQGGKKWQKDVSVRPPALVPAEIQLVRDLKAFWQSNSSQIPFSGYTAYLLRNFPKSGIELFHRSGFYPDFILWIKDESTGRIHVRFIDPHGLHHGGLVGNEDKFEALRKLSELSNAPAFQTKRITLDGFVLTRTSLDDIPDRGDRGWMELETQYLLMRQEGNYARRLLTHP